MSDPLPAFYTVVVTILGTPALDVRTYEVAALSALSALEHLKGCGWVRWDEVHSLLISRGCTARSKP